MKIIVNGVPLERDLPVKVTKTQKPAEVPRSGRTHQGVGPVRYTDAPDPNTVPQIQLTSEHRDLIRRREQLEDAVYGLRMQCKPLRGEITQLRERIRQLSAKVGRPVKD